MHTIHTHDGAALSVDFSSDASMLVSSSYDGTIKMWKLNNDEPPTWMRTMHGHTSAARSNLRLSPDGLVKFSPDDKKIASSSDEGAILIWDAQSGARLVTFKGHKDTAHCAAWSPDSRLVASGGKDKKVLVWDAVTGTPAMKPLTGHTSQVCVCVCLCLYICVCVLVYVMQSLIGRKSQVCGLYT
jgi:WD40 repeat protein